MSKSDDNLLYIKNQYALQRDIFKYLNIAVVIITLRKANLLLVQM